MRTAVTIALATLLVCFGTSAMADDSSKIAVPMAVAIKGPSDYPPDALKKKEEGLAVIAIELGGFGSKKVWLVHSSGFDDLDQASLELARNEQPTTPVEPGSDKFLVGVHWSLNPESLPEKETIQLGD
jgi:outer membrane biosynthesis protein TonB